MNYAGRDIVPDLGVLQGVVPCDMASISNLLEMNIGLALKMQKRLHDLLGTLVPGELVGEKVSPMDKLTQDAMRLHTINTDVYLQVEEVRRRLT